MRWCVKERVRGRYGSEAGFEARPIVAASPSLEPAATPVRTDPDVIEALGDEIATLSAHIAAATHRLLVKIAEFDRLRGWESTGARSCAHWLMERTSADMVTAREKVRVARALAILPLTSAAMERGELSFSKVRAMTRGATPENEATLVELAGGMTTAQLECFIRAMRKRTRKDEAQAERERFAARTLSVFPDDDGMYMVTGRLTPEQGALLMRAVEAGCDLLYRQHGPPAATLPSLGVWDAAHSAAAQRRADALTLMMAWALSAGEAAGPHAGAIEPATGQGEDVPDQDVPDQDGPADTGSTPETGAATARTPSAARVARTSLRYPISGLSAERYQVMLHVEHATLQAGAELGRSELEDGTRVSAESSRRMCCDASMVTVEHADDGSILNVGRRTRTIPPALRRGLEVRDRGCRFPGCGARFTDAHHVIHWADGGQTSLRNCVLVCSYHHRLVHEGGWRVQWWGEGRPVFIDPRGGEHFDGRWRTPRIPEDAVAALMAEHARLGVLPNAATAGARWRREADIPRELYLRACEVL